MAAFLQARASRVRSPTLSAETSVPGSPTWEIAPQDPVERSAPVVAWMKARFAKTSASKEESAGRQLVAAPPDVTPTTLSPPPRSAKSGPPESPLQVFES